MKLIEIECVSMKVLTREIIAPILWEWRSQGKRIVFTNGCFDLIHLGHIYCLERARREGDVLIVGLNSDASVRLLGKGPYRPIQTEVVRAAVLAATSFVDAVVLFDEASPERLVEFIEPDVLVKGSDWKGKKVAGKEAVEARGGRVVFVDMIGGFSTTAIVERIHSGAEGSCP